MGEVLSKKLTRRTFLIYQALIGGAAPSLAYEAVSTTALAHPEWDMEEEKTWEQWKDHHERSAEDPDPD